MHEGGWRAGVNNASGNSIQCLQSTNLHQALLRPLGIYHKTRLSALRWELDSSGRWKGFDIQCHLVLSSLFCFTGDEAVGMFAPRRQESSGQLYAPQYPALGFGQGKCSIIRDGGGRECGIFCLSFLGITNSPSIHLQTGGSEMTDI